MNAGYYTALSSALEAKVISIEPQKDCHAAAYLSTFMNRQDGNIKTLIAGAWSTKTHISVPSGCSTGFSIQTNNSPTNDVPTIVVDDLLEENKWEKGDLIKIDTEGNFRSISPHDFVRG